MSFAPAYAAPICANDNDPNHAEKEAADRRAAYEAAMVEWYARQKRAKAATKAYYANGHRVMIGGYPVKIHVPPTPHMLAVMRGDNNTKALREMIGTVHPQTTYVPSLNLRALGEFVEKAERLAGHTRTKTPWQQ